MLKLFEAIAEVFSRIDHKFDLMQLARFTASHDLENPGFEVSAKKEETKSYFQVLEAEQV